MRDLNHGPLLRENMSLVDHAVNDSQLLPGGNHCRLHHKLHRSGGGFFPHAVRRGGSHRWLCLRPSKSSY